MRIKLANFQSSVSVAIGTATEKATHLTSTVNNKLKQQFSNPKFMLVNN